MNRALGFERKASIANSYNPSEESEGFCCVWTFQFGRCWLRLSLAAIGIGLSRLMWCCPEGLCWEFERVRGDALFFALLPVEPLRGRGLPEIGMAR